MVGYYDSSVILAALLAQRLDIDPAALWDAATVRLSSNLLKVECIIGVRRAGALQPARSRAEWTERRIEALERHLAAVHYRRMDEAIEAVIRSTGSLSDCRTLDAIHLATALYLAPHIEEPLSVVTLDNRMRSLAVKLGFSVLP
ncbi:MAG: PIN domain-containing protein [Planctomycetes bacterium]|nr:PIN domain-containing protein [Planctomycetota bacterium]